GAVVSMPDDYIAMSQPHLSLPISDEQYRSVLAVIDRWRKYPQPSYNLDTHNCVTFVREIAIALRLPASNNVKFIHSPKEFLEDLQLRTSKTNRIVATARPQRPIPGTQPHTDKTKTVKMGVDRPARTTPQVADESSSKTGADIPSKFLNVR